MNKNLQKLANVAWKEKYVHPNGVDFSPAEAFAELIVRQCISLCLKNNDVAHLGPGCTISAMEIEKHFGIHTMKMKPAQPADSENWIEP